MVQKIKDFLNNSFLWLLFLVGCIAYLFRKEKHLEDQLREQKFDDALKETKDVQAKIDSDAAADYDAYQRLYTDYMRYCAGRVQQGSTGPAKAGSDSGSKN